MPGLGGTCAGCAGKVGRVLLEVRRSALSKVWRTASGDGFFGPDHLRRPEIRSVWFATEQANTTNARAHAEMAKMFLEMGELDNALVEAAVALNMPVNQEAWSVALEIVFSPSAVQPDSTDALRSLLRGGG